jgi:hypothetical protein
LASEAYQPHSDNPVSQDLATCGCVLESAEIGNTVSNVREPVRLHVHWVARIFFGAGAIFYPWVAYSSWQQGDPIWSVASGFVAALSVWAFFLAGTKIDVDERGIQITAPHGVYELGWAEIESVEIKEKGRVANFFGGKKAVGYNLLFAGKGKREVREYIAQVIQERQIAAGRPAGVNFLKLRRMYKNSKVRSGMFW